jgi:hypothetical protein
MTIKDHFDSLEYALAQTTPADYPAVLGELERLKAKVWGSMMNGQGTKASSEHIAQVDQGRWLTVTEAAELFRVSRKWLYRHKRKLPHSQPSRRVVLFPEVSMRKWFAARKRLTYEVVPSP